MTFILVLNLTASTAEPLYRHTVCTGALNVRSGAGMVYPVVDMLYRGDVVIIESDEEFNPIIVTDADGIMWAYIAPLHWNHPIGWACLEWLK